MADMLRMKGIAPHARVSSLTSSQLNFLFNGDNETPLEYNDASLHWIGINNLLVKLARSGKTEVKALIIPMLDELRCPTCEGSRLNALARHVTIQDHSIADVCAWPIENKHCPS